MNNEAIKPPKSAFRTLLRYELILAKRTPYSIVLGLAFPVILLIIFGSIPALHQKQAALGNMSYFAVSVPVLIGFAATSTAFMSLPTTLVSYREQGILRRMSTTPVPPMWLLAAQVLVNMGVALFGLILLVVVGISAYGLNTPKNMPGFIVGSILTLTSVFAVGLWLAAIARSNTSSKAIGGILFYIVLFFGGLWVPRESMPPTLLTISNWTPLGASVAAIQNSFQGTFPTWQALECLAGYSIIFFYLAVRYFNWE